MMTIPNRPLVSRPKRLNRMEVALLSMTPVHAAMYTTGYKGFATKNSRESTRFTPALFSAASSCIARLELLMK